MNLNQKIINKIKSSGPISFSEFMEIVLYSPEGYYSQPEIIGKYGDYYTASEVHPVYGYCFAKEIFSFGIKDLEIVEFGAGSGSLARDILNYLNFKKINVNYTIIETSESFLKKQKNKLSDFKNINWITKLTELNNLKNNKTFIFIANEFFDSLPFDIFVYDNQWFELKVTTTFDQFDFVKVFPDTEKLDMLPDVSKNIKIEVSFYTIDFLKKFLQIQFKGTHYFFIIDYGLQQEKLLKNFPEGSLQCFKKHKATYCPFDNLGKQDITCFVNFTILQNIFESGGWENIYYQPQRKFIQENVFRIIQEVYKNPTSKVIANSAAKKLLLEFQNHQVCIFKKS